MKIEDYAIILVAPFLKGLLLIEESKKMLMEV
jgi:hypothetical protein